MWYIWVSDMLHCLQPVGLIRQQVADEIQLRFTDKLIFQQIVEGIRHQVGDEIRPQLVDDL